MSIQPSASARVPRMTRMLRVASTRTMASAGTMGRRMLAISPTPKYWGAMMMAPYPGAMPRLSASRGADTMPLRDSGVPTW
ncbi:hypothetical protein CCO03_17870 [Comamonas serinivorans]|uniref:Uncharacterized protein n=1 Tax=Comamonas serinivorans TaxID=1082851 RepID=A0A1Y0ERU7_9BURK|nr:hypothetical protein CCO03_17870 [Comamonas serinivorans]